MSVAATTIIENALREMGVEAAGESVSPENAQFMFSKLNRLVDQWRARNLSVYSDSFTEFTIIASHTPHTIGVAGADWTCTVGRPSEIVTATLVLTSTTPNVDMNLPVRDDAWWSRNTIKGLTSTIPTDLYYSPDFPLGNVYLWPAPTTVNKVRLQLRNLLESFADLVTTYDLPFGYEEALTLSLAEAAAAAFAVSATRTALLMKAGSNARSLIFARNTHSPNISTELGGQRRPWHWLTGGYTS